MRSTSRLPCAWAGSEALGRSDRPAVPALTWPMAVVTTSSKNAAMRVGYCVTPARTVRTRIAQAAARVTLESRPELEYQSRSTTTPSRATPPQGPQMADLMRSLTVETTESRGAM